MHGESCMPTRELESDSGGLAYGMDTMWELWRAVWLEGEPRTELTIF